MHSQGNKVRNIVADRHSVAAGHDVNVGDGNRVALRDYHEHHHDAGVIDPWFRELSHRFAGHADDRQCMHCEHCGLRGQPPRIDACLYCHHDIGAERRSREAAAERRRWWRRRLGDVRFVFCFGVAVAGVGLTLYAYPRLLGSQASTTAGGLLAILLIGGLLEQAVIGLEVWIQYTLPRWLRAHGLGWMIRS